MAQLNVKVRRIADWLAGSADSLTPDEIRLAARHLRDAADGRPFDLAAVAELNRSGRMVVGGEYAAPTDAAVSGLDAG